MPVFEEPVKYGKNKDGLVGKIEKKPEKPPEKKSGFPTIERGGKVLCKGCGALVVDGACGHGRTCEHGPNPQAPVKRYRPRHDVVRDGVVWELKHGKSVVAASVKREVDFDLVCPVCKLRVLASLDRKNNFAVVEYSAKDGVLERAE